MLQGCILLIVSTAWTIHFKCTCVQMCMCVCVCLKSRVGFCAFGSESLLVLIEVWQDVEHWKSAIWTNLVNSVMLIKHFCEMRVQNIQRTENLISWNSKLKIKHTQMTICSLENQNRNCKKCRLDVHESVHRDKTIKITKKMHYID
jgi:hypothetical protein